VLGINLLEKNVKTGLKIKLGKVNDSTRSSITISLQTDFTQTSGDYDLRLA